VYAGALVTVVTVNADKGITGTVTIDDTCKTTLTSIGGQPAPVVTPSGGGTQ
jgi:hypothetical protein